MLKAARESSEPRPGWPKAHSALPHLCYISRYHLHPFMRSWVSIPGNVLTGVSGWTMDPISLDWFHLPSGAFHCWRSACVCLPLGEQWGGVSINSRYLIEIKPEYSLERDWCWSADTLATWCEEPTHWKRLWCWERLRTGGKGVVEDEMAGWPHWLSGHEFEQTPGDSAGQGSLACCSPWGHKESDMT